MTSKFLMRGFSAACLCLALCLGGARTFAQQDQQLDQGPPQDSQQAPQDQGPPQQDSGNFAPQGPQQSAANIARVSFVQGDVKMRSSEHTDFQQAVANMPLLANSSLQTGQDGEAEVEFADGSVARITPNSSLALGELGQDSVEMQQNSGLLYYELNFGQGHPAFRVELPNAEAVPAANAIFRINLDNAAEVAVMTGSVEVSGNGFAATAVSENQSLQLQPGNGAPYTIAQNLTPDSWDQWNQDRDQEISQEAAQQTSVRNQVGDSGDENWNDLDAYGNWYSVPNEGNVWVPGGVSTGWDPFGYGYWAEYPGFGYTYISGYPWGWLPYHCGLWNYYGFGWGWNPGGCGGGWFPVVGVHGYRGYFLPRRPALGVGVRVGPLVAVDRGALARGPWGAGHSLPSINHDAALNIGGHAITPLARAPFQAHAGAGVRGTSPGVRTALGNPGQFDRATGQGRMPAQSQLGSNSRSTYAPRSTPTPHYSAPAYHYSAPPTYHYSPGPRGGGGGRR